MGASKSEHPLEGVFVCSWAYGPTRPARAVPQKLETEAALAFWHCRIFKMENRIPPFLKMP